MREEGQRGQSRKRGRVVKAESVNAVVLTTSRVFHVAWRGVNQRPNTACLQFPPQLCQLQLHIPENVGVRSSRCWW